MKTTKLFKASYLIVIPMLVACDEAPVAEKGVDTTLEVTDQSAQNDVEELRSEKLGQSSFSDDLTPDIGVTKSKAPAGSRKTKAGNLPSISSEAYEDGSDEYEYYEEPAKIAQLPKRAIPRGNPSGWVTNADYPSRALREGAEGTVGFTLTIGANGLVIDCFVARSSGNEELDSATCRNMQRRARFDSATDEIGSSVQGAWSNQLRWEIPD